MENLIHKPENPAKTFLRRYRALVARQESIQRSINAAYDRAYSCTARLKPVTVTGGNGAFDRMAEDVAKIADETEQLREVKAEVNAALADVLRAIEAVPDDMQKAVLTLRYVEGLDWISIAEHIHYERTQTLVLHGRALWNVRKWMEDGEKETAEQLIIQEMNAKTQNEKDIIRLKKIILEIRPYSRWWRWGYVGSLRRAIKALEKKSADENGLVNDL